MNVKNQDKRHFVLSEIHRLLSVASASDFLSASRSCKSANIRRALESLAQEQVAGQVQREHRRETGTARYRRVLPTRTPLLRDTDKLLSRLLASPRFRSRADIARFAHQHQLSVSISGKDSKQRILQKLLRQILAMSGERRDRVLENAFDENGRQTEGWVQVMKNTR
jgi:hypothetical protein